MIAEADTVSILGATYVLCVVMGLPPRLRECTDVLDRRHGIFAIRGDPDYVCVDPPPGRPTGSPTVRPEPAETGPSASTTCLVDRLSIRGSV
jgi:hypothetical protein